MHTSLAPAVTPVVSDVPPPNRRPPLPLEYDKLDVGDSFAIVMPQDKDGRKRVLHACYTNNYRAGRRMGRKFAGALRIEDEAEVFRIWRTE